MNKKRTRTITSKTRLNTSQTGPNTSKVQSNTLKTRRNTIKKQKNLMLTTLNVENWLSDANLTKISHDEKCRYCEDWTFHFEMTVPAGRKGNAVLKFTSKRDNKDNNTTQKQLIIKAKVFAGKDDNEIESKERNVTVGMEDTFEIKFDFMWDKDFHENKFKITISIFEDSEGPKTSSDKPLYVGITNPSNICYINVNLQSLYHIKAFRNIIYNINSSGHADPASTLKALFDQLDKKIDTAKPDQFLASINMTKADLIIQNDSNEFLNYILNYFNNKYVSEKIYDIFGFNQLEITKLQSGEERRDVREKMLFWNLQLSSYDFIKCIKQDRLGDENGIKHQTTTKFITLPKIAIITLSWTSVLAHDDCPSEKEKELEIPMELDLKEFTDTESEKLHSEYTLYGIVIYGGTGSAGHYLVDLRPELNKPNSEFFSFSDRIVTKKVDESFRKFKCTGTNQNRSIPNTVFYVRKDCIEELWKEPERISAPIEQKLNFRIRTITNLKSCIESGYMGFKQNIATDSYSIEINSTDTYKKLYETVRQECKNIINDDTSFILWARDMQSLLGGIIIDSENYLVSNLSQDSLFLDEVSHRVGEEHIRIFLIYFDPTTTKFQFIDTRTVKIGDKINTIMPDAQAEIEKIRGSTKGNDQYDIYMDDCSPKKPQKISPNFEFKNKYPKQGSFFIFVPKDAVPKIEEPSNDGPYTLQHFYEKTRKMNLENYYMKNYFSWVFKVYKYGDVKVDDFIIISVYRNLDYHTLADFLTECFQIKDYHKDNDELLIFPAEYVGWPNIRPAITNNTDPYENKPQVQDILRTHTAFYYHIFKGQRGQVFNETQKALVRVSYSEDSIHISKLLMAIVEIPFTPADVLNSLNIEIDDTYRVRHVIPAKFENLSLDTKIYEKRYSMRVEKKPSQNDCAEITIITGREKSDTGNYIIYGEPISMPVSCEETFFGLIQKYCTAMNVREEDYDFVCLNDESKPDQEFLPDTSKAIIEAARRKLRVAAISKKPSMFLQRNPDVDSRY